MKQSAVKSELVLTRILVAEDDFVVQMVVKRMLEQAGFTADLVSDGQEVISALEAQDYDLVLMDCLMPRMDGFEATCVIRNTRSGRINPGIPIIAMTGLTKEDDKRRCTDAGMNAVLQKPVDANKLVALIQQCLGKPEHLESVSQQDEIPVPTFWEDGFLDNVIDEFLAEVPRVINDLQQAIAQGDTATLRSVSHRFRGAADILKATALSARSRDLEQAAKDGDIQLSSDHASELIRELQKLTSLLTE